jgi:GNAT superfamily N-acetyltransferase
MIIREAIVADAAPLAKVVIDTWRSTYAGIVPQAFLDSLSYDNITNVWRTRITDTDNIWPGWFIYVAENEVGKLVGFAGGGPSSTPDLPFSGELGFIYLLKEFQGRGTGRQLFATVALRLKQQGHKSMVLWVFTANKPSRAFYESMGGKVAGERIIDRYGGHLSETAYGWKNLDVFDNMPRTNL